MSIITRCKSCSSKGIRKIYQPIGSLKGSNVFICGDCDLIFSNFQTPERKHNYMSISCDSDWGNIRHGKKNRLNPNISFISKHFDISRSKNILDIGSNRTDFLNYISKNYPRVKTTGIETDKKIINNNLNKHEIIIGRFEELKLNSKYDFIYCSQTLEHIDNLELFFKKLHAVMHNESEIYFEVPNTQIIQNKYNYAEYFIDKHSIHFTPKTFLTCLLNYGFIPRAFDYDNYNIQVILKKEPKVLGEKEVKNYKDSISFTRKELLKKCQKLNDLSINKKIAFLGISNIFDSLVKYGKLKVENINYLIDNFLFDILLEYEGKKIYSDEVLKKNKIDTLILLTGSTTNTLKEKYSKFANEIIHINDI